MNKMNIAIIIAAILIAGAIIIAPIANHSYKMSECIEIEMKALQGFNIESKQNAKEICVKLVNHVK